MGVCEDTDQDHTCDYGCGKVYGDQAIFRFLSSVNKVEVDISVTSVYNDTADEHTVQVYAAFYRGGRLLSVKIEELAVTAEGVFGTLSLNYEPDLVPDECKVMLLSADGRYAPVCKALSEKFR